MSVWHSYSSYGLSADEAEDILRSIRRGMSQGLYPIQIYQIICQDIDEIIGELERMYILSDHDHNFDEMKKVRKRFGRDVINQILIDMGNSHDVI